MGKERILVTGATGFVGRQIVRRLMADGYQLTLAVRRIADASAESSASVAWVETGDLADPRNLEDALRDVATVVHVAGLAHITDPAIRDSDVPFVRANAVATEKLVDAAAALGVHRFIHVSSLASITGNASDAVVNDATAEAPTTPYGRSKRRAEAAVRRFAEAGGLGISLRPPLIVGSDARGNWAALQKLAATGWPLPFGDIDNKRSMIGIDSVADAVSVLCAHHWPADISGDYAIADREALSLTAIVTELRSGMGKSPRLFPFPASLLQAAARALGQSQRAAGLLGDLVVDGSRFRATFKPTETRDLRSSIRLSGAEFMRTNRENVGPKS